ncbi:hypothetical protein [Chryseobacterium sp.]|uniref:hypothetical protein n=1 Tax=Chryseobacterium sp. TaxID=1871047 RepID=UPI0025C4B1C1|nr:hypothetical protein [Chryseobacterium sp.]MBV8325156.1 hypothetical protein [Chryseobacterium sp.]
MRKIKILPLILLTSTGFVIDSCNNQDDTVQQPAQNNSKPPAIMDATFTFKDPGQDKKWFMTKDLTIRPSEIILVFRNQNSNTSLSAAWAPLPDTRYYSDMDSLPMDERDLIYNFVYDNSGIDIGINTKRDLRTISTADKNRYLNNQTFRLVIVPGANVAAKSAKIGSPVDYNDYQAVISYYHLNDTHVPSVQIK